MMAAKAIHQDILLLYSMIKGSILELFFLNIPGLGYHSNCGMLS